VKQAGKLAVSKAPKGRVDTGIFTDQPVRKSVGLTRVRGSAPGRMPPGCGAKAKARVRVWVRSEHWA